MADLISRQDAVSEINVWIQRATDNETDLKERIQSLPSAEPKTKCIAQIRINRDDMEDLVNKKVNEIVDNMAEPKTGKWVRAHVGTIAEGYYCSRCGKHGYQTDFCHNCGARMLGEDGEKCTNITK